jgi:plasmid stabilization system protein ParE
MGQRCPEYQGDYRSFTAEPWVIFYRVTDSCVEIHRVLDAARDIERLLG